MMESRKLCSSMFLHLIGATSDDGTANPSASAKAYSFPRCHTPARSGVWGWASLPRRLDKL